MLADVGGGAAKGEEPVPVHQFDPPVVWEVIFGGPPKYHIALGPPPADQIVLASLYFLVELGNLPVEGHALMKQGLVFPLRVE